MSPDKLQEHSDHGSTAILPEPDSDSEFPDSGLNSDYNIAWDLMLSLYRKELSQLLKITVDINGISTIALIDSGTQGALASKAFRKKNKCVFYL
jgi:hypothetical protein